MPRVRANRLRHAARVYAAEATVDVPFSDILRKAGLDPDHIVGEDARVEALQEAIVLEACCDALDDKTFAARAALATQGAKTLMAYIVQASETVGEALQLVQRYYTLEDRDLEFEIGGSQQAPFISLVSTVIGPRRHPRHREFLVFGLFKRAQQIAGPDFAPLSLQIESTDPAHVERLSELAACKVEGGHARYALILPPDGLNYPITTSDRALLEYLRKLGEDLLREQPEQPRSLSERISAMVRSELPGRVPNGDEVAQALGMTRRTLTRRLTEEGTGFKSLVENARCDMAKKLILRGESIAQVAFLLDFADQAAFSVAFKRWTGTTPARFRKTGN